MSEDPWKHRSSGMKCNTCMWFVLKRPPVYIVKGSFSKIIEQSPGKVVPMEEAESVRTTESNIGRCRRHAPTMNGYPVVFKSDWCGDHRVDEEKL